MELPRDEIAFRKEYEDQVLDGQLKIVFRPGNRVYPSWRGYKPGEVVTARIIEEIGSDAKEIPPQFNDHKIPVQIASVRTFKVNELTAEHFDGSSPDVCDVESLKDHLSHIYGKPLSAFDDEITRIELSYLS